ncbi:uncharacterized protein J4E79_009745 [Alternaria viburni]|uniref:uncharacterized protein n=1 Tax=Alternaria viburni TaxID=566460 RepID=UPI0020C26952|nr:uncharacterized protein J4E79_009745 [Alternaria viburni]KAI4649899.1 hypothetical protein J4E79_009745 [Alternaria viburni]
MRNVMSICNGYSRPSINIYPTRTRNTAIPLEVTGPNTKSSAQATHYDVLAAHSVDASSPPASISPLLHTTRPAETKELQHAPLIDECIKRLQEEKKDSVKASPSFNTTEIRGLANNKIGFVSVMRLSTVQTLLARYVSMNDLAALANACSAIGGSLNLGDEKSRKMFEGLVKDDREALENLRGLRTKRKLDGGEETVYAPSWRPESRERKRLKAFASVSIHD